LKITVCDVCREERPDCREVPNIRVDVCEGCLDRPARALLDVIVDQSQWDAFDPAWSRG
jgi:hypothetical protein